MKDWVGNNKSIYACLGASNHTDKERESNDYYATEPKAIDLLCEQELFTEIVWECACGEGHLSRALQKQGYRVISSDLVDRGFGTGGIDFLQYNKENCYDIITNPPYKYAQEFIEHGIDISCKGTKIAMFLKLTFMESKKRKQLFINNPPKVIYVSSSRLQCAKNAQFKLYGKSTAVAYGWFVWEVGYQGATVVKWIN